MRPIGRMMMPRVLVMRSSLLAPALCAVVVARMDDRTGRAETTIIDNATGKRMRGRVHLKDGAGKGQRAAKFPFWNDHFVCPGTVRLEVPPGKYTLEIERGPEYELF